MSIPINILGTIVNYPSSGEAPNNSVAQIQFAQLVAEALNSAIGAFDIAPQTQNIDADNAATADITNLIFPVTNVRAVTIYLAVYRTNTSPSVTVDEYNIINISYNPTRSSGNKWAIQRERVAGDASITFAISDTGQFSYTTTSIGSGAHTGFLSFVARTLINE